MFVVMVPKNLSCDKLNILVLSRNAHLVTAQNHGRIDRLVLAFLMFEIIMKL